MYQKELTSIKKANRFRQRIVYDERIVDLASNDYLGLAQKKELLTKAYENLLEEKFHSPKASMLVNGYSNIHKKFEDNLKKANNFEDCVVVGSGFLANISLIEALVRKGDKIFIDEEYHASGMLASKLLSTSQVIIFRHNDMSHLKELLSTTLVKNRKIIAVEGIYSMHGDIVPKEIFSIADSSDSLLIVDEAHSSGVLGNKLLGLFDFYKIKPKKNHIKMGTLGKAYGSYGAYILASNEIVTFLLNRAKAIIYTTAPSLFDISLGDEGLKYILSNGLLLKDKIQTNLKIVEDILGIKSNSLIIPIVINDNKKVLQIQNELKEKGFLVGAIRQPTVKEAIIRLIIRTDVKIDDLKEVCTLLKKYKLN